jgi:hypothetical protein
MPVLGFYLTKVWVRPARQRLFFRTLPAQQYTRPWRTLPRERHNQSRNQLAGGLPALANAWPGNDRPSASAGARCRRSRLLLSWLLSHSRVIVRSLSVAGTAGAAYRLPGVMGEGGRR